MHPDQFTLLSSPDEGVTARSIAELVYQAGVAERIGADAITLQAAPTATERRPWPGWRPTWNGCRCAQPAGAENDDRIYTPADLLPLCARTGLPFVYDVHHHRCHPDGQSTRRSPTGP